MRREAYRLFEIVSWPAAVWCGAECGLRMALGTPASAAAPALLGVMALGTIWACRARTRQLAQINR